MKMLRVLSIAAMAVLLLGAVPQRQEAAYTSDPPPMCDPGDKTCRPPAGTDVTLN